MNQTQNYALKAMVAEGKSPTQMAQILNKKVEVIKEALISLGLQEEVRTPAEKAGIITKTALKKNRSVGVMTQMGSQKGDESRKRATGKNRYANNIHKPKG